MEESGGGEMPEQPSSGTKPDFRVVQVEFDQRTGKTNYKDVGAMWKNIGKNGNEFYTLKIGKLRLLVFPNDRKIE
jgi:uncharacterized protein (DUF736 family)